MQSYWLLYWQALDSIFLGKAAGFACDLRGQTAFCMSWYVLLVTCIMVTQYFVICLLFGLPVWTYLGCFFKSWDKYLFLKLEFELC